MELELSTPSSGQAPSAAQSRFWTLHELAEQPDALTLAFAFELRGPYLCPARLANAFASVVQRHESLRTGFLYTDDGLIQKPMACSSWKMEESDLRSLDALRRATQLESLVERNRHWAFDLEAPPLIVAHLVRTDEAVWRLFLAIHHIAADEWSVRLLLDEISRLYNEPSLVLEWPKQMREVAEDERRWLATGQANRQEQYWRAILKDTQNPTDLPFAKRRPRRRSYRYNQVPLDLTEELSNSIDRLARENNASRFMVLSALVTRWLAGRTGVTDLVLGTPSAVRPDPEDEAVIGPMVNTVALRARLDTTGLQDSIARTRITTLEALGNDRLPFDRVVSVLEPVRNPAYAPLCQVMVMTQRQPGQHLQLNGLESSVLPGAPQHTTELDLAVVADADRHGTWAVLQYADDLYTAVEAAELAADLARQIDVDIERHDSSVAVRCKPARPARRLQGLDLQGTPAGKWNLDRSIDQLILRQCEQTPNAIAMGGAREATYAQFAERTGRIAATLTELGVGTESRVGLCCSSRASTVEVMVAILRAGGAFVPLDSAYPADRLAVMYEMSTPHCVVGDGPRPDSLPAAASWTSLSDLRDGLVESSAGSPGSRRLAYIIFTSGSTGVPKAVAMTHRPIVNLIEAQRSLTQSRRTLQFSSLNFGLGYQEVFTTLATGGTLVVADGQSLTDLARVAEMLRDERIQCFYTSPVALQELAQLCIEDNIELRDLRVTCVAGEALTVTPHLREMFCRLPKATLINQYGASETHATFQYVFPDDRTAWPDRPPIGSALPGVVAAVLPDSAGATGPRADVDGVTGELVVGGVCLGAGYFGRQDLTDERFVARDSTDGHLYLSGDRVRKRTDGLYEFAERMDDQIQLRGYRIELGDIEAALALHPLVTRAVALPVRRDGRIAYIAALVTLASPPTRRSELRQWVADRLPEWMLPARIEVVDEMPLTRSGKVDRRALIGRLTEHQSHSWELADELENWFRGVWCHVLKTTDFGPADNFIFLGGDSLAASRIASRVRRHWRVNFAARDIFAHPTVSAQAMRCKEMLALMDQGQPAATRAGSPLALASSRLALDGGVPVRSRPWPTYDKGDVFIHEADREAAIRALESDLYFRYDVRALEATEVGKFEADVRQFFGTRHALAVSSGTAALALALMALDLPAEAKVACPGFTFAATPSAILLAKCRPVLIEVDENLHFDLNDLRAKADQEDLSAIMVVHMRGLASDIQEIRNFADSRSLPVVEDAVPILGASVAGRRLGTIGTFGAFSTQADKSVNTGEGGFLITDDTELFARAVVLSGAYEGRVNRHPGLSTATVDDFSLPLFNFRMDEIRGALAAAQMRRLPERIGRLGRNYRYLHQQVQRFPGVVPRKAINADGVLGDALVFRLPNFDRKTCSWFARALRAEGVEARALGDDDDVNVRCFWNWRFLFPRENQETIESRLPYTARMLAETIDIPLAPGLQREDCDELLAALRKVLHRL